MRDFAAIDFETANNERTSVCSVGVVIVRDGEIVDSFYSLIQPEPNYYNYWCTQVHGITRHDTESAPVFPGYGIKKIGSTFYSNATLMNDKMELVNEPRRIIFSLKIESENEEYNFTKKELNHYKKTYSRLLLKKNIYEKLKRKDLLFI